MLMTKGHIHPSGKITFSGDADEGFTLMALDKSRLVYHTKSGAFWNNAGRNPYASSITVIEISDLKKEKFFYGAEEVDGWTFSGNPLGLSCHSVLSRAKEEALEKLRSRYE